MKLSIVIPCFNEKENIPLILDRFSKVIFTNDIHVILVNNGSTDGSEKVLKKMIPKYKFSKLVEVKENKGYGFGIIAGLKKAKTNFVGWTHADLQTDPKDVIKAWELMKNKKGKNIFVKGSRKKRPLFDQFFSFGMSIFESIYLKTSLWDINAQPNIFPKEFFESWENPPYDFSLDLYVLYLAKKNGLKILRFPVEFPERIHGVSKWNTGFQSKLKFIKRTLLFSKKLKNTLR